MMLAAFSRIMPPMSSHCSALSFRSIGKTHVGEMFFRNFEMFKKEQCS